MVLQKEKQRAGVSSRPWALADVGEDCYFINGNLDGEVEVSTRVAEDDLNSFYSEEVAQGFANAFRVMILLRQCEGAGELDQDGDGWIFDSDGDTDRFDNSSCFTLCPPFPSEALACAAANSVGIENIKNAYKFLSNIKD